MAALANFEIPEIRIPHSVGGDRNITHAQVVIIQGLVAVQLTPHPKRTRRAEICLANLDGRLSAQGGAYFSLNKTDKSCTRVRIQYGTSST
jgi:hypothetical protein